MIIEAPGYIAVECDTPLPCPFCGSDAELAQVAHAETSQRIGRSRRYRTVRVALIASTRPLKADTFWFRCSKCRASTGDHQHSAQRAVRVWNRRAATENMEGEGDR